MANQIELLVIPLTMLAYFQAMYLSGNLGVGLLYFALFLFIFTHLFSSIIFMISNKLEYGEVRKSMALLGFGPAVITLVVLLMISILPFIKWPFYLLKWIPYWDVWITPFILGLSAYAVQLLVKYSVNESIYGK